MLSLSEASAAAPLFILNSGALVDEKQQKFTRWDQAETRHTFTLLRNIRQVFLAAIGSNYQTGSKSVFKEAGRGTSCLELVAGEGDLGQA